MTAFPLLCRALDRAESVVPFFFRDDDAGWGDAALLALCETFAGRAPLDLAVIPDALGSELAGTLLERPAWLRFHQHGRTHRNHQATGRKCEFPEGRSPAGIEADIRLGRDRLRRLLGDRLDPIFTPPWNRCGPSTVAAVARLGFEVLSRDAGQPPAGLAGLVELPVTVDWVRYSRQGQTGGRSAGTTAARWRALDAALAAAVDRPPVGVMLHHEVTPADDLSAIAELLDLVVAHPAARPMPMLSLAGRRPVEVG